MDIDRNDPEVVEHLASNRERGCLCPEPIMLKSRAEMMEPERWHQLTPNARAYVLGALNPALVFIDHEGSCPIYRRQVAVYN